jgi:hypothetical protein
MGIIGELGGERIRSKVVVVVMVGSRGDETCRGQASNEVEMFHWWVVRKAASKPGERRRILGVFTPCAPPSKPQIMPFDEICLFETTP